MLLSSKLPELELSLPELTFDSTVLSLIWLPRGQGPRVEGWITGLGHDSG